MRTLLTLLVCGALHAQIPATRRAQHRDSEYRHPLHRAHLQDAGGVAGAARAPAQTDSLRRRPAAHAAEERPASADLRPHREQDVLHREGAARDHAGLLSRRQSLSPAEAGAGRRLPGHRLPARPLELRTAGAYRARVGAGALHQSGAAGLRGLLLRHGGLQRHHPDAARFRQPGGTALGLRTARPAVVELHPRGGFPAIAARRRRGAHRRHRSIGRRHADVSAGGGGRPHTVLRAGEHDLGASCRAAACARMRPTCAWTRSTWRSAP